MNNPEPDLAIALRDRWRDVRGPLFTDLYELVMAQIYFETGLAGRVAQFDYFYRSNPDYGTHQAGYGITVGLEPWLAWLSEMWFRDEHLEALGRLRSSTGDPLFRPEFLTWLGARDRFHRILVESVAEGRVVHPHLPIVTVTGPLAATQIIETSLLNHFNYATLIATKASRIANSAHGAAVLEFGMRRGPGMGVTEGIRGALIGGCVGTSNVESSVAVGYQPRGTHAHALVQAFIADGRGELEAFRAMARSAPDDCVLLVDTIDTLDSGIPNAITAFEELVAAGHTPAGVRLDSGDLAYLAVRAARMLDEAGFAEVPIVLSGDLDELTIWQIRTQVADDAGPQRAEAVLRRLIYGVGTRLITSSGDSALNGVYKLVGLQDEVGEWAPAVKISESPAKIPLPGRKQAWRLYDRRGLAITDLIGLHDEVPLAGDECVVYHPTQDGVSTVLRATEIERVEPLRTSVFAAGHPVVEPTALPEISARRQADVDRLDVGVRRLVNPHRYHVSITEALYRYRQRVIADVRT